MAPGIIERFTMKKLMIISAAVATLALVAPASAQVRIDAGPGGVEVGVGGPRHYHRHHRGYRAYSAERCRYERTEIRRPNGSVVVKRTRICR
jgi:hypothetical protein